MERPVIFLQSLLVLVVAIQVISACICGQRRTMKESICAEETLVMATTQNVILYDMAGNTVNDFNKAVKAEYTMHLNTIFPGPNQFADVSPFNMAVLRENETDCNVLLELETVYFIAGVADMEGKLNVNSCDFLERVAWEEHTPEEMDIINDQLHRHSEVKC